jgi:cell division protein FtsW
MSFIYYSFHNLVERVKFGKWQLVLFPVLFTIIGIYIGISTSKETSIKFDAKDILIPAVFFATGFLIPISLLRRYIWRFSAKEHFLWNKDGFSFAFLFFVFMVFLQISAIWLDSAWDNVYVAGLGEKYTEAQLKEIGGHGNEIIMLKRQLTIAGESFQVGEFVKVFFMLFIAKLLTDIKIRGQIKWCREFFAFPLLAVLPIATLAYCMPNYSMIIIFAFILFFMMLIQEMDLKLRIPLLTFLVIPIVIVFFISGLDKNSSLVKIHGIDRVWAHFNEGSAGNEQQMEALQAISDGGIVGKGLDGGTIKLRLFGARNDFAYSILGEELGLWLLIPITVAMMGFLFVCFWIAAQIRAGTDKNAILAQNIAWGIAIIFSINMLLHIGVNLKLLPNTGQPLSFISSGTANLAMNFFLMGMLVQISSLNRDEAA